MWGGLTCSRGVLFFRREKNQQLGENVGGRRALTHGFQDHPHPVERKPTFARTVNWGREAAVLGPLGHTSTASAESCMKEYKAQWGNVRHLQALAPRRMAERREVRCKKRARARCLPLSMALFLVASIARAIPAQFNPFHVFRQVIIFFRSFAARQAGFPALCDDLREGWPHAVRSVRTEDLGGLAAASGPIAAGFTAYRLRNNILCLVTEVCGPVLTAIELHIQAIEEDPDFGGQGCGAKWYTLGGVGSFSFPISRNDIVDAIAVLPRVGLRLPPQWYFFGEILG